MCFFFFNDTATTEIYTLSLHDALPISGVEVKVSTSSQRATAASAAASRPATSAARSEEHTSELQSRQYLVCRLLLEKKKARLLCIRFLPVALTVPRNHTASQR